MMKLSGIENQLEHLGLAAVGDLLHRLLGAEVTPLAETRQAGSHHQADGLIRVNYGDATHLLVIEVKAHGAPRFVRAAVHQLD